MKVQPIRAALVKSDPKGSVPDLIDDKIIIWSDPFGYFHVAYPTPLPVHLDEATLKKEFFARIAWEREKTDYDKHSKSKKELVKRYSQVFSVGQINPRIIGNTTYVVATEVNY